MMLTSQKIKEEAKDEKKKMTNTFYRETQTGLQCPKHALNAVVHYVAKGQVRIVTDDSVAKAMAKLPLDYYQNVIHEFFPE